MNKKDARVTKRAAKSHRDEEAFCSAKAGRVAYEVSSAASSCVISRFGIKMKEHLACNTSASLLGPTEQPILGPPGPRKRRSLAAIWVYLR